MAKTILQNAAAVFFSLIVALFLLALIEYVGAILHPFPDDFGGTREEVMEQVANYPPLILGILGGLGWGGTMLVATWLATRLSANRRQAYGIGVGLLLLAAALFNMSMLPYPIWYWVLELVVLPLGIFFGSKLGAFSSPDTPEPGAA